MCGATTEIATWKRIRAGTAVCAECDWQNMQCRGRVATRVYTSSAVGACISSPGSQKTDPLNECQVTGVITIAAQQFIDL